MQEADLIILNGASYEKWLTNVSLPPSRLVNTSQSFEDRLIESGETITHSHGPEGQHSHMGVSFTTWMDLSQAIEQAQAIKEALVKLLPTQQQYIEEHFKYLANDLNNLDQEFQQTASTETSLQVVFSHPVYHYFQRAYHVKGQSVHWEAEDTLDLDQLHEIEHLIDDLGIQYMVWEGDPMPSSVAQLKELGVNSVVMSPMGRQPEEGDFLKGMEQNLEALRNIYRNGNS